MVRNGVVEIEGGDSLPEGTRVNIEPVEGSDQHASPGDSLFDIGNRAVPIGHSDLATNLDHYLYGHPKASDEQH
jgi:hypothetical protein